MSNTHESFMKFNINTVVSAFVGCLVALVGYGAKHEFEKIDTTLGEQGKTIVANNLVLTRVEATQGGVLGRLSNIETRQSNLETAVKEFVTKSEFRSELSMRDQEILDLKKEIESLRRRTVATRPSTP